MGNKKHKKESKKRKRHSRSRSSSPVIVEFDERERKRHHKRKHKKDKKPCKKLRRESSSSSGSDDDVVIINSPSPPPPPPPPKVFAKEPEVTVVKDFSPPWTKSNESLSIAQTNALRAKLGLKPLQVDEAPPPVREAESGNNNADVIILDDVLIEGEEGQFVHKPAESLTKKKESEKLRNKLAERKEKRTLEKKYNAVKTLGDNDGDDSTAAWVKKSRKIEEEKRLAARRAAELDEMDEIFGVSNLIKDEIKKEKDKSYSNKDLKGLTVEHDAETFSEGKTVILTLKDKEILSEDNSDTLVNVNMIDDERHKKNLHNKKVNPYNFDHLYDEEDEDILDIGETKILRKYDEEIDGEKKSKFVLGEKNAIPIKDKVKAKLRANMTLESLDTNISLATDYYTSDEMAKFKKPKKVRKIRKKPLKADELLSISQPGNSHLDLGTRKPKSEIKDEPQDLDTDDTPPLVEDLSEVNIKMEEQEEETELESALMKARRLRQMREKPTPSFIELGKQIVDEIKQEINSDEEASGSIVLNSTAEFCRTLGDIPTYGLAGNREEDEEADNNSIVEEDKMKWTNNYRPSDDEGGWQDAQMDTRLVEVSKIEAEPILDAEPDLGSGVGGALHMAVSKGYLEKDSSNRPNAARFTHLQAQNYSIEDKSHADDEKHGNRRDRYMGPTSDFKEKDLYKPKINLEYIDDDGRILSPKEAFRYLSHKFHGKGPGKNKIEKRMKKNEQEVLMKQMSSSDTPLGTLQMLQYKQKETQSPYVVLSGNKQLSAPSISKTKMLK